MAANYTPRRTPDSEGRGALWTIIVINTLVFVAVLVCSAMGVDLIKILGLPAQDSSPWQPFSYMFTHANLLHFLVNMIVLTFFGFLLTAFLLGRFLLPLYLAGGFTGAAAFLFISTDYTTPALMVGSSAAILSLTTGFTFWLWNHTLKLGKMRIPLYIPGVGVVLLALFASAIQLHLGSLAAHLAGVLTGLIIAYALRPYAVRVVSNYDASREAGRAVLRKLRRTGFASLTSKEKEQLYENNRSGKSHRH